MGQPYEDLSFSLPQGGAWTCPMMPEGMVSCLRGMQAAILQQQQPAAKCPDRGEDQAQGRCSGAVPGILVKGQHHDTKCT